MATVSNVALTCLIPVFCVPICKHTPALRRLKPHRFVAIRQFLSEPILGHLLIEPILGHLFSPFPVTPIPQELRAKRLAEQDKI